MLVALFLAAVVMRIDEDYADDDRQPQVNGMLIAVVLVAFVVLIYFITKEIHLELSKDVAAIQHTTKTSPPNRKLPQKAASPPLLDMHINHDVYVGSSLDHNNLTDEVRTAKKTPTRNTRSSERYSAHINRKRTPSLDRIEV